MAQQPNNVSFSINSQIKNEMQRQHQQFYPSQQQNETKKNKTNSNLESSEEKVFLPKSVLAGDIVKNNNNETKTVDVDVK